MLDNKILRNIQDVTDELYPALAMLKQYRHKEDVPFGFLMCVTLRAKIYKNIQRLIKMYKNQEPHADLLNRVLNQLKLHRFQIKKLSTTSVQAKMKCNEYFGVRYLRPATTTVP